MERSITASGGTSVADQINKALKWIEENKKSLNVVQLSQALVSLGLLCSSLSHLVHDAYELQTYAEHNYDTLFAQRFTEVTKGKEMSAAAAKPAIEWELSEKKKEFLDAKIVFKKLSSQLDRLDKIQEGLRTLVSTLKTDLKHTV